MTLWKYKRKNTLEIKHNWKTTTDLFFKWLLHLLLTYLFIINTAAAFFFFSSENSVTPEEFTRGRLVGMWTSDVGLANWSECFPSCSFVESFPKLWRFESNLHSFSGGLQPSEFKGPLKLPPPPRTLHQSTFQERWESFPLHLLDSGLSWFDTWSKAPVSSQDIIR